MKAKFRLFRRGNVFWFQDNNSGRQGSLHTKDRQEAVMLLNAKNEAFRQPLLNLQIARAYLAAGDPAMSTRTWQYVMDEVAKTRTGATQARWERAVRQAPFDTIRKLTLLQTRAEDFLEVLQSGTISTNIFLRRLHNFALDMNWLPVPILPRKQW